MGGRDYARDFHDFDGAIYLNCAFHGAMPRVATDAVEEALRLKKTPHLIRDEHHFTFPDAYRAAVAELIGAAERDVAVTNSATQGTMILVAGLDWRPGDEVVIPAAEFPSNRFPWRSLEARGVVVREVELTTADEALTALAAAIGERTRVVSVSWVAYSTGLKLDLAALGRLCRERDVLLAVDGSQGIGGLRFDLASQQVDLLSCAGYKWMLGPYGVGFAWVQPGLAERLTPGNINWFSLAGARDFNRLSEVDLAFEEGARRFDVNEPGNFFNMAGAAAAARYLLDIGMTAVEEHAQSLLDRLLDGLPAGLRSRAPTSQGARSNIVCIAADSADASATLFARLQALRIHLSRREGALRVSPHLFNRPEDIDRLLEALADRRPTTAVPSPPARGDRLEVVTATAPERGVREGEFVRLRPLRPAADVADLYAGAHQPAAAPALWAYLPYGPFESEQRMEVWLAERSVSDDPLFLAVERRETGRAVGMVAFQRIEPEMRVLELAHIWYLPAAQRTEVNTESVYLMLSEAFDERRFRRIEWKCDALNTASRRAAVRLGFAFEGVFRQHMLVKRRNRDTAWYALLDGDWPRVRRNMERWLYSGERPRPPLHDLNRT